MSLCRIEVITSLAKFSSLKSALSKAGVRGMTVMQVLGCGVEKGTREYEVDENYEMEHPDHLEKGVKAMTVDGKPVSGNILSPVPAGSTVEVKIVMG